MHFSVGCSAVHSVLVYMPIAMYGIMFCALCAVQCSVGRLVLLESVQCAVCSVGRLVLLESGPVGKPERLISPAAALQVEPFIIAIIIIIIILIIFIINIVIIIK